MQTGHKSDGEKRIARSLDHKICEFALPEVRKLDRNTNHTDLY
jgi:hypothetical protein